MAPDGSSSGNYATFPSAVDTELTLVRPDVALITVNGMARVSPSTIVDSGLTIYTLVVRNEDLTYTDTLLSPYVDIAWSPLIVNGDPLYPSYAGVVGGEMDWAYWGL